jgi:hypothetical protein
VTYSKKDNDGGSNAIKGFIYQFDLALLETLNNPLKEISIEQKQDLSYEEYHIQVKLRSQDYAPSSIKPSVIQLLEAHKLNPKSRFCLHCHFPDKNPLKWVLSLFDLNHILGNQEANFTTNEKEAFIKNFHISFGKNFRDHFEALIKKIQESYTIPKELAICYHAIFQSAIFNIATKAIKGERLISKTLLDNFIINAENVVFDSAYTKYLGKEKYLKIIKEQFFKFKSVNIDPLERLFIIECHKISDSELISVLYKVQKKFFRPSKSPPPYVYLKNCVNINLIKQKLADKDVTFTDGTLFNGDKFRLDRLTEKPNSKNRIVLRFVNEGTFGTVIKKISLDQTYNFFVNSPPQEVPLRGKNISIKIESTRDLLKILE